MLMEMFMKDNGKMISPMALENTNIQTGLFIKVNGRIINKTEKVFKSGPMDKNMKDNSIWVLNQEKEFLNLMMDHFMKGTFSITKFMEKVILY